MKHLLLTICLFVFSCSGPKYELDELPVVYGGLGHKQDKSQYQNKIDLKGTEIHDYLISQNPDIESVLGLAKFQVTEMDSSILRPFELYLLETHRSNKALWQLITVSKENNSVIDSYDFNPDLLELRYVYQHS